MNSHSNNNTLAILLVVLIVLVAVGVLRFLVLIPMGIVENVGHGFHLPHIDRAGFWIWPWAGVAGLFGLALLVFWIAVVVWVYNDAERHGMSGAIWALVVFFVHLLGLIIYFAVRSGHRILPPSPAPAAPSPGSPCPKCGKATSAGQAFCPSCAEPLRARVCPKCGKETQRGWVACPYCGQKI